MQHRSPPARRPRLSVLMSVHNGADYLREAIDSILRQSLADFELVVIDDASTDGCAEILRSYRDARIVGLQNRDRLGLTRSLNRGLRIARGDYIARIDADDRAHPQRLRRQAAFLDRYPDHILVGSGYREIDAAGEVIATWRKPMGDIELRWVSLLRTALEHSSVTFRRTRADGAPVFYDERWRTAQDAELWLRLLEQGKGCVLEAPLLDYRVHDRAISSTHGSEQAAAIQAICTGFTARHFRLDPGQRALIQALSTILNTRGPFTDAVFGDAVSGLQLLTARFIAAHRLDAACAAFIRARGAGQLWNAVLRRRRLPPGRLPLLLFRGRAVLRPLLRRIRYRHRPPAALAPPPLPR